MKIEWNTRHGVSYSIYEDHGWHVRLTDHRGDYVWPLPPCFWEGVTWQDFFFMINEITDSFTTYLGDPYGTYPKKEIEALFKPDTRKLLCTIEDEGMHGDTPYMSKDSIYLCRDGCILAVCVTMENTGNPLTGYYRHTSYLDFKSFHDNWLPRLSAEDQQRYSNLTDNNWKNFYGPEAADGGQDYIKTLYFLWEERQVGRRGEKIKRKKKG